jgi:hypothetical protein
MLKDFVINLFVVGAQKAGTTALAHFLAQHPEICMYPEKELHFFDFDQPLRTWGRQEVNGQVRDRFPNYVGQPVVGEATPVYMYLPPVPSRIREYNPDAKIIVLLRNPVERAASHYAMSRSERVEWLPFEDAFRVERFRLWRDRRLFTEESSLRRHSYVDRGRYIRQIRRLLEQFPQNQVLFVRSDRLLDDHAGTVRAVYEFLRVNRSGFLPEPKRLRVGSANAKLDRATYRFLARTFEREIDELEKLLGWNLDEWRERNRALEQLGTR